MVPVACDLACRVRDGDADGITRMAEAKGWDVETKALLVVLAAMVPDDGPVGDLLAWTDGLEAVMEWRQAQMLIPVPGRPVTEPCGTYAAARRHMRRKEPVDEACRVAYNERHRAESRASMARVRAQRAAAGEAGQDAA
jgi:hypothetical protein